MLGSRRRIPLHNQILIGLLLGAIFGIVAQIGFSGPSLTWLNENVMKLIGDGFLALIFMIVVPLLLSALILGVAELGDVAKVGRIGIKSLIMTVVFSSLAVLLAFALVNIVQPGKVVSPEKREELQQTYAEAGVKKETVSASEIPDPPVAGIIPRNPLLEASRALSGGILPFMFFALVFGLALAKCDPEVISPLKQFFNAIFEVSQKVIEMVMTLAPIGVFALIFRTASTLGLEIFATLGAYAATVLVGLAIHQFVVYSFLIRMIAKRNPWSFFRQIRKVMLTAFATSSSNATLPVALQSAEEDLGLPKEISSFVLTVGATANQNGTALFEGVTIIFFCQLFGIALSPAQQLQVLGLSIVAGIGTAGVPGGSWPVIGSIVRGLGVPAGAIGMALGVDRILDMSRTVLNVTGDIAIAACVAELEGKGIVTPSEAME